MPEKIQELFKKRIIPVTFERNVGLFKATTIGVGALMGAGLYVLVGLAAGAAGPSVWIAYMICGALAFLTTLMFAELARIVPKSGGGFAYAYDALGSLGGFVTGWFLALGSMFACAIYAIGFAHYFTSILGYRVPHFGIKMTALIAVIAAILLNRRGTKDSDIFQSIFTWGNLAILASLILFSLFKLRFEAMTPLFPNGLSGTGAAISIIYISFFGYQLIANNADEIVEPTKTVPKAMILAMGISFIFYVLVALTAILVIPWRELADSSAPLLTVATRSIGKSGWFLISA
ncbi:MAG: amino acid permease, partial [Acidobacteria bacterium]|nr:amino acid permease [Acidobacteriota bacterium]